MRPIVLGGYAAKSCPVKVQWAFTGVQHAPPSPEQEDRLVRGHEFEAQVVGHLRECLEEPGVFIESGTPKHDAVRATVEAMAAGVRVVVGGRLPDDPLRTTPDPVLVARGLPAGDRGGRTGSPDMLVRVSPDGSPPGYIPGDVKAHGTLKALKTTRTRVDISSLPRPWEAVSVAGMSTSRLSAANRFRDLMQLAHYTRMLQAAGFHAGPNHLQGLILGTSPVELDGFDQGQALAWFDLTTPQFRTYSRSSARLIARSALDRYDHEHSFRLLVAEGALLGSPPLVEPIGQTECDQCGYLASCDSQMSHDGPARDWDASWTIEAGRPDLRNWLALRAAGIRTLGEFVDQDLGDPAVEGALRAHALGENAEPNEVDKARTILQVAQMRGRMVLDGKSIQTKVAETPNVPCADVEIDHDIEWDLDGRVYMWGLRLRDGQEETTTRYVRDFTTFETLDSATERDLAAAFVAWLREQAESAQRANKSIRVFHWTHPEIWHLRRLLPDDDLSDLIGPEGIYFDLNRYVRTHFDTVSGTGIKKVAQSLGYKWKVSDPGGAISQVHIQAARGPRGLARDEARQWLTDYNDSDVEAQAMIRDSLRRLA